MAQGWPRESFPPHQTFAHPYSSHELQPERRNHSSADDYNHDIRIQNGFDQERNQISNHNGRLMNANDTTHNLAHCQQPLGINEMLRRQCGVPIRQYFIAAIEDDGKPCTFVSDGYKLSENVAAQFFDARKFQQVRNRLEVGANPMLDDSEQEETFPDRHVFNRNSPARSSRKRPGPRNPLNEDKDAQMVISSRNRTIIGDSNGIWRFYEQQFENCQQEACKLIAKTWIKLVEPKKQSTHPYAGRDEKAPDWWPKPWGPAKYHKVRHKEPDHLYKRERLHLLAHILRLITTPNDKQHPDIRKLGLSVTRLEETTAEALSLFFVDSDANALKKPFLAEIFKVARQEERFMLGDIDGSTAIYVMSKEKMLANYVSENNETRPFIKEYEGAEPVAKLTPIMGGRMRPSMRTTAATLPDEPRPEEVFTGDLSMCDSQCQAPMMNGTCPLRSCVNNGGALRVDGQPDVSVTGSSLIFAIEPNPHGISCRLPVSSGFLSSSSIIYPQMWQASSDETNGLLMYAYTEQQPTMSAGLPFMSPGAP